MSIMCCVFLPIHLFCSKNRQKSLTLYFDIISDELKDFMGDTVSAEDFNAMFSAIDMDNNGTLEFLVSHNDKQE